MTPNEVIEKLKELGLIIRIRTLQNYSKNRLIPSPQIRGLYGGGRECIYPPHTPYEFYASWIMVHAQGKKIKYVAKIRSIARGFQNPIEKATTQELADATWWLSEYKKLKKE